MTAMTSNRKNWLIIVGIAVPTSILSAAYLNALGTNDENIQFLLRVTARVAFLLYLIVFIARPLQQLFATNTTKWMLRERRSFGLAFGTVHLVHGALIIYLADTSSSFALEFSQNLFGGGIYLLILLMMITSFNDPARVLGTANWRLLHKLGLYAIGIAFVQTLLPANAEEWLEPGRLFIVVLTAAAILIRLSAFIKKGSDPIK